MKTRIMSVIVMAVMVMASVGAVALTDHSDATADKAEIYSQADLQVDNDGSTRAFQVNEQQFIGYAYTLTWYAGKVSNNTDTANEPTATNWDELGTSRNNTPGGSPTFTQSTASVTIESYTVTMTSVTGKTGFYNLEVTGNNTTGPIPFGLKCEIKVTMGSIEKTLSKVYYLFNVISKETVDYTFTPSITGTMKVGVHFSEKITVTDNTLGSVDDYYWYAIGLPEGISMSDSGYVSGVPLNAKSYESVKIVATHKTSDVVYTGTMEIMVSPADGTLTEYSYEVFVENVKTTGPNYAVVQNETVVLKTYKDTSTVIAATTVNVIGSNGVITSVTPTNTNEYTIPTDGTGAYRIVMTFGSGDNAQTAEFYLFVSPSLNDISAGITISGN